MRRPGAWPRPVVLYPPRAVWYLMHALTEAGRRQWSHATAEDRARVRGEASGSAAGGRALRALLPRVCLDEHPAGYAVLTRPGREGWQETHPRAWWPEGFRPTGFWLTSHWQKGIWPLDAVYMDTLVDRYTGWETRRPTGVECLLRGSRRQTKGNAEMVTFAHALAKLRKTPRTAVWAGPRVMSQKCRMLGHRLSPALEERRPANGLGPRYPVVAVVGEDTPTWLRREAPRRGRGAG